MNPLTLLPLLAAAALAAPGAHHVLSPAATVLSTQQIGYAAVPLTQNIHYENRPVVTGYQSTVLKPSLHAAPLALSGIALGRQIPDLPTSTPAADFPTAAPTIPPTNSTQPPADFPTPAPIPTQPPTDNNGTGSDQPLPIPGVPVPLLNTANLIYNPVQYSVAPLARSADAVVLQANTLPVAQVAAVRAAQAGDFGPLVTQEKVLAPGRTHTQITPQYTQIQPEISVRRIVQEVPVATPVAYQTPVIQQYAVNAIPANTLLHGANIIHA